ncbi:FAD-dependent oxidoreductase [Nonomuraea fastidiosa]|uniref:FAD-dependent oxidoreductase n=1 Tax=Nonomuraea TaxID=83681 RepID=UPI00324FCC3F
MMDVIVGGGVVGLSVAWRLACEGRPVTVVDPAPATGASHAAAGMLAPVSEVTYTEAPLLRLGMAALSRWPAFAAELAEDAGLPAGEVSAAGALARGPRSGLGAGGLDLRAEGTLDVAFGSDDMAMLDELAAFMEKLDLPVERLTGRECRRLEPMLAPSVRGGLLAPGDAWVNPRRVTAALLTALERRGVPLVRARVSELVRTNGAVTGVRLSKPTGAPATGLRLGAHHVGGPPAAPYPADAGERAAGDGAERAFDVAGAGEADGAWADGDVLAADRVVLAAGAWSGELADVPVRPVKGQIMRLRSPQPLLTHCVRGTVHGSPVYLVPRGDGELVVGATQEELGFDTTVTAGGLYELLRDARELVPGVTEMEVADVVAGLRPGTPDNLPVIGPARTPGLTYATGHHRGGVLMAPLTAAILMGEESELATLCSPGRFQEIS